MKKVYMATTNKGKVEEISKMINIPLEFAKLELDEIQSMDLEYIARKKAEEAFKILKKPVIVDDVGVYINAWNKFPGPFVKYVHNLLGNRKILDLFKKEKNRKIIVQCAVAYHDGKKVYSFVGTVRGKLALNERGSEGWGFDPIIIPEGFRETFAEMGLKKKNLVSHRGKAFKKLKKFLDSQK